MKTPLEVELLRALDRLSIAVEGFDSLRDDESRAETYAKELKVLSKAQDSAREAIRKAML